MLLLIALFQVSLQLFGLIGATPAISKFPIRGQQRPQRIHNGMPTGKFLVGADWHNGRLAEPHSAPDSGRTTGVR
jgi:hypothetical protein